MTSENLRRCDPRAMFQSAQREEKAEGSICGCQQCPSVYSSFPTERKLSAIISDRVSIVREWSSLNLSRPKAHGIVMRGNFIAENQDEISPRTRKCSAHDPVQSELGTTKTSNSHESEVCAKCQMNQDFEVGHLHALGRNIKCNLLWWCHLTGRKCRQLELYSKNEYIKRSHAVDTVLACPRFFPCVANIVVAAKQRLWSASR